MSKPQRDETVPSWLDTNFIENGLKQGMKNSELKILKSEITMATAVGDNYGSQMFRFNLAIKREPEGKEEKMSVIAKTIPSGAMGKEIMSTAVFETEEKAFAKILPAIGKLLEKAYPGHRKLWADCYYHQGGLDGVLLLEDLSLSGFVIANRFEGLDIEHSVLVLKSLAKLHAASLVLMKEDPNALKSFEKSFWRHENMSSVTKILTLPFDTLSKEVLNWDDLEEKDLFSKKLKTLKTTSVSLVTKHWERDESKLNVLLHGDSWVNNFMFRYDSNGKLDAINFVDFQLMSLNSPVLDLQYFIFMSVRPDLKFENLDFFLETYHEAFEDTLRRLDHKLEKPFSLEDLKKDFQKNYAWGMLVFFCFYPIVVLPQKEALHPDDFFKTEEGSPLEKMYLSENVRDVFKKGLRFFEKVGVL